jgi:hypothetical protein
MKTSNSNVIVYVKQPVHREQARVISESIGALHGVVSAQNSSRVENMICVDYNPRAIDAQHILECVSNRGFPARLVGM